jgi:DUF2934 family protein
MAFMHQQIESFLNLGVCKEYPIMAKPKPPKKANYMNEPASALSTPSVSGGNAKPAEAASTLAATEARKTPSKKSARKPEIVKAESRPNLVPINLEDEIRRLAYLLAERRGFETGHEIEDWLAAEREVRQRYRQHSA